MLNKKKTFSTMMLKDCAKYIGLNNKQQHTFLSPSPNSALLTPSTQATAASCESNVIKPKSVLLAAGIFRASSTFSIFPNFLRMFLTRSSSQAGGKPSRNTVFTWKRRERNLLKPLLKGSTKSN